MHIKSIFFQVSKTKSKWTGRKQSKTELLSYCKESSFQFAMKMMFLKEWDAGDKDDVP